jgi:hypothetical protein
MVQFTSTSKEDTSQLSEGAKESLAGDSFITAGLENFVPHFSMN